MTEQTDPQAVAQRATRLAEMGSILADSAYYPAGSGPKALAAELIEMVKQAEAERDEALALLALVLPIADRADAASSKENRVMDRARAFLRRHDAQPGGGG